MAVHPAGDHEKKGGGRKKKRRKGDFLVQKRALVKVQESTFPVSTWTKKGKKRRGERERWSVQSYLLSPLSPEENYFVILFVEGGGGEERGGEMAGFSRSSWDICSASKS